MINHKSLTPPPATEPVLIGEPASAEVGYRIPAPEDPIERAAFEAGVARRKELGLSPFVGEDYLPRHAKPGTPALDTAVDEVIAMHDRIHASGGHVPTALSAAIEQLRQAVRLKTPTPAIPLVNVRVLDQGALITAVRTVTIPAVCPTCGGPRCQDLREVKTVVYGIEMAYDAWENACGHQDLYGSVLVEARRFNELVRGGA